MKGAAAYGRVLRELAKVPARTAARSRDAIFALIDDQFNAGTDSYGAAWEGLKRSTIVRKGHSLPGTDTYLLRGTTRVEAMAGAGLSLSVGAPYAHYFDSVRPVLPDRGMPATWRAAIAKVYREQVAATVHR